MLSEDAIALQRLLDDATRVYEEVTAATYLLNSKVAALSQAERCDLGYLAKQTSEKLDAARKELDGLGRKIATCIAVMATKAALTDPTLELKVQGEIATGIPNVHQRPKLPQRGTPEYATLLEFLGVPASVIETNVLDFSFSQMTELLTARAAEGKPLPPGLVGSFPEYSVRYRKKT